MPDSDSNSPYPLDRPQTIDLHLDAPTDPNPQSGDKHESLLAPSDQTALPEVFEALPPTISPYVRLERQATAPTTPSTLRKPKLPGELFEESLPWTEPIDLAELLDEIACFIRKLVVLEDYQADAAALWIAHTYVLEAASVSPLCIINAPERACAKTLFQTTIGHLCRRPIFGSNVSLSVLFRLNERWHPTILIDEADTFLRHDSEITGLINAGYKQGGAVLRTELVANELVPKQFDAFGPKSIAGIALEKHLKDSTLSRGIIFNLRRKLPGEQVLRQREVDPRLFAVLTSKLERFRQDYLEKVKSARPFLPNWLDDRSQDNWEVLFAIAELADDVWQFRAHKAASMLSKRKDDSTTIGAELLSDIRAVFETKKVERITTSDLIQALIEDVESPWATNNRGHPITPRQLATFLKPYGISSKTVRFGLETPKGYEQSQFVDAFARYLGAPSRETAP